MRRWMIVTAVCLVAAVAAIAYAAGKDVAPEVIRAQRFELVDAEGRVRGALWMGAEGDQPSLVLGGEKARARAILGLIGGENPCLTFHDAKGEVRAMMSLLSDGSSDLVFYDRDGEALWQAP